jgi:hypothetical protein
MHIQLGCQLSYTTHRKTIAMQKQVLYYAVKSANLHNALKESPSSLLYSGRHCGLCGRNFRVQMVKQSVVIVIGGHFRNIVFEGKQISMQGRRV